MDSNFKTEKNIRFSASFFQVAQKQIIQTDQIIDFCKKKSINCCLLPFTQLERALGIVSMKASKLDNKQQQKIYIFITSLRPNTYLVTTYYNKIQLIHKNINSNRQIPQIILNSLQISVHQKQSIQSKHYNNINNQQNVEQLFKKLGKKMHELRQKDQISGIQILKSSNQYYNIIKYIQSFSLDLQELCRSSQQIKNQLIKKNEKILNLVYSLEQQKKQLETLSVNYQSAVYEITNVRTKLDQLIHKKREIVQKKDFYDQESLNRYVEELTQLKILQNQKKYLS